ncbi:Arginyl-tRNA synthetase mitochondrial [Carabus blaptoides fortunei]
MSAKLKLHISNKVYQSLRKNPATSPEKLKSLIQIGTVNGNNANMNISLDNLQNQLGISNSNDILAMKTDNVISKVYLGNDRANRKISFDIDRSVFVKDVLENINHPDIFTERKKVVVEYSSPNIAKPFHVGHLRSTIIGNFISNINKYLGHEVVRLNYLGDWGTQFGLLKVGVDLANLTDAQIKADPLKVLYDAYVNVNKMAKYDPKINEKAREIFTKLEKGELEDISSWKLFNKYTIDELSSLYKRLGVTFDEYNFESMYSAQNMKQVIDMLEKCKVIQADSDGKKVAMINDKKVSLIKSDGSMLYLTRDIAAALDRYGKYKFDQMLYVVDNSQSDHFNSLNNVLFKMDLPWAGRVKHVKFGRIRGMSTRKGTAVFLKDILNEAKELMQKNQVKSPTTRVPISDEHTSDILGITCVIVNDLKQRRQRDYEFDWNRVLQVQGDTGVRLQYTHCRLTSLERINNITPAETCNPEFLEQPEVMNLVIHLAQFNEILRRCHQELEACLLTVYLFHLCNYINKALKVLRVKDQDVHLAAQRMLLFSVAKETLRQGMEILGLQPLLEM